MKLVYINDELATGDGSNAHALGMLSAFKELLGESNVYSFPLPKDGSKDAANIRNVVIRQKLKVVLQFVRYFRKKINSIKRSKAYIAEMESNGFIPTHVLARSTVFDVTANYVAKYFNAKLIYEINTPMYYEAGEIRKVPMERQMEVWERKIIEESVYVYVVSKVCRDMLCEHYNINTDKFIVVPNGYMEDLYTENDEERQVIRDAIRKKENIIDKFVITFVGSLKVWHGIQMFCEIAEKFQKDSKVHFLIIGDGEMRKEIVNYVQSHDNMTFMGKLDYQRMKQYLYASDLGLMPYNKQENFYFSPLKMFDMIGAGLPFVGTRVAQIEDIVNEFFDANFLVENNNPQLVIKRINNIVIDKEAYSSMEQKVIKNKELFTWKKRAQYLLEKINRG
ncbi:glycosyltransferase [Neobacillus rhizosphaerae]|uniref:glycosyltransferase n=1 Tax=Neobacillus rhizosphaerae TaxID=2880965 RepID=UPI003D266771